MKQFIYLVCMVLFVSSCNKKEIDNLTYQNQELQNRIDELENTLQESNNKIEELNDDIFECQTHNQDSSLENFDLDNELNQAKFDLSICEKNYEGYRYGNMVSITRYVEGSGQITVYGAENIIDFLNKHYVP